MAFNDGGIPAAIGGTQTSTTKALLAFIHVPKVYRVYIANEKDAKKAAEEKEEDELSKSSSSASKRQISFASLRDERPILPRDSTDSTYSKQSTETKIQEEAEGEDDDDETTIEQNIGYVEAEASDRSKKSLVEHVVTAEEMATVVKLDDPAHETDEEEEKPENETSTITSAMKVFFGVDTNKQDEVTGRLNREEAIRAMTEEEAEGEDNDDETTGELNIGYVEAEASDRSKKSLVEHVVTAEEMATIVKLDDPAHETDEEEEKPESETNTITSAMKVFFGVVTNKQDEVTGRLNREEAIRAMKEQSSQSNLSEASPAQSHQDSQQPAPNTEIKVQALLQLTCKNLYNEGCFFTAPTITSITKGEQEEEWVQFTIMCKPNSIGVVLERLERIGVGSSVGMISIYKSELLKTADWPSLQEDKQKQPMQHDKQQDDGVNLEAARNEWKNAASRLRIEQVKEQIQEQAELSFDFLALLVIASILAGIGLITDSTVIIVASMLVSPIMGPVMGMTFGSRVVDWSLTRSSALNELGALLIAVFVGAVIGFASSFSPIAEEWPTEEMGSRGDITGLITGIAIAIPSGMGVALSILGNNTASLVGVAISASLLPPAVNAGICWAHAILIRHDAITNPEDFAKIGAISFALTVVNIVCIWVSGMAMFAIKEVAPSENKSAFWARDIKVARAIKKRGSKKPVDLETIKIGLQDALERKREEGGVASRARFLRRRRRRQQPADFSFNIADDPIDETEEYLEHFMLGLNPIIDGAQTLELADRAAYLGFRASLQDFEVEEEDPVPGKWFSLFGKS